VGSLARDKPICRQYLSWKVTELTPNIGHMAETDDVRPGLGWSGVENLEQFVKNGGVFITAVGSSDFAIQEADERRIDEHRGAWYCHWDVPADEACG
jgi:hypothetical protein